MLGNEGMIYRRGASQSATFIVAASDSLHQGYADYVCDGVDDQVQIQAAIDALSTIGGTIQLTEGHFNISSPITIEKNAVRLIGMGQAWGFGGTSISLVDHSDCNMIEIGNTTGTHIFFPTIESLYLFGNNGMQASGHGIATIGTSDITDMMFTNIAIDGVKQDGLHFGVFGWLYSLNNVWVEYCGGAGMYCYSGDPKCTNCTFLWNTNGIKFDHTIVSCTQCEISYNGSDGIHISAGGTLRLISSRLVANGQDDAAPSIRSWDTVEGIPAIMVGNIFYGDDAQSHAIMIMPEPSDYVFIYDNVFSGYTLDPIWVGDGQNTHGQIRNNSGYITESSGTATLLNGHDSIAVDHGLDVTPDAGDIVVTPISTWGSMASFYIDTYTSTQFTIHANTDPGANVDFAWKAIVL